MKKYISITLLIITLTLLTSICVIAIIHLNFLIGLPYENERYFDANSAVVYHSQSIIGFAILILLCILLIIITVIFIRRENEKKK